MKQLMSAFQRIVRLVSAAAGARSAALAVPAQPARRPAAQRAPRRPAVSSPRQAAGEEEPAARRQPRKSPIRRPRESRAARLAQARAAARAREMREVQTPRFKVDELGQEVPDVRAEAAIIYNPETNQVLWESNAQEERSIASITKVMTALVFLESGMPLSTPVTVQRADVYRASTTYLRAGYNVTADDLLNLLLIGSDNAAARALARVSPYGAVRLHRSDESEGRRARPREDALRGSVGAARDQRLVRLRHGAAHRVCLGRRAHRQHHAQGHAHGLRRQAHDQRQQHESAGARPASIDVLGGKTGFISRSGYCLATLLRLPQSRPAGRRRRARRAGRIRAASGKRVTSSTG